MHDKSHTPQNLKRALLCSICSWVTGPGEEKVPRLDDGGRKLDSCVT